jgi:hypothetical protein
LLLKLLIDIREKKGGVKLMKVNEVSVVNWQIEFSATETDREEVEALLKKYNSLSVEERPNKIFMCSVGVFSVLVEELKAKGLPIHSYPSTRKDRVLGTCLV